MSLIFLMSSYFVKFFKLVYIFSEISFLVACLLSEPFILNSFLIFSTIVFSNKILILSITSLFDIFNKSFKYLIVNCKVQDSLSHISLIFL